MRGNSYIEIDEKRQKELLEFIESSKRKERERKRAMAILLNSQKKSVKEIASMLNRNTDTVYDWLIKFKKGGIQELIDKPMPGRPKKLNSKVKDTVKEVLKK
jgi:transposase